MSEFKRNKLSKKTIDNIVGSLAVICIIVVVIFGSISIVNIIETNDKKEAKEIKIYEKKSYEAGVKFAKRYKLPYSRCDDRASSGDLVREGWDEKFWLRGCIENSKGK